MKNIITIEDASNEVYYINPPTEVYIPSSLPHHGRCRVYMVIIFIVFTNIPSMFVMTVSNMVKKQFLWCVYLIDIYDCCDCIAC